MKKGQIAGQIFIYVIAVVVVGLILAYGYTAIKDFSKRGEEVEYITLKTDFENSFKSIISDFGSIKRPDLAVPGKYSHICFVKKDIGEDSIQNSPICTRLDDEEDGFEYSKIHSPVACSAWKNGRNNVFFMPDGSDAFDVGEITIKVGGEEDKSFICIENVNNKVKLQLKGLGDKVQVSEYQ